MSLRARFECPACQKTAVVRERLSERPAPECSSCSGSPSGRTEMVWVRDV